MRLAAILAMALLFSCMAPFAAAESVNASQRRAATDYLTALASGGAQQVAFAIHPDELDRLRLAVQRRLREEVAQGEVAARARLFGDAATMTEIERLTSVNFFRALARQIDFPSQSQPTPRYEDLRAIGSLREGDLVHVLMRGRTANQAKQERGAHLELVSLLPYGRDWKAAVPSWFEARVEDLLAGRAGPMPSAAPTSTEMPPSLPNTPQILALLDAAERTLVEGRCDRYYREHLSPALQRSLGARALETLINACARSLATRELLIAALRVVRRSTPAYAAGGTRASYDVSGQGLPFDRFLLEQEQGRWYIAE